jgi:vacuolar protein 8
MVKLSRVTDRDIKIAGSLEELIRQLVEAVTAGSMEAKEKASGQIRSLAEQNQGNADAIAEAGAIKPLVTLIANGSSSAQTHACVAISKIANGPEKSRMQIVDAGVVLALTNAVKAGDSALQEQAAAAIETISILKPSRAAFIKAGAVAPLVNLLKNGSVETQVHVCESLARFAEASAMARDAVAKVGALPLLVGLLGQGKAQEAAAHAIAELSRDNEANQAEVHQLGGIPKLIALLTVMNREAQAQAASALAAVSTGERQDVIAKAGVIRPLLVLLESRHESCERNAATAIAMLALKHRANQDSIARMGGIGPLVKLTDLGQGHSADVQAQAVLALAEISRHNKELQTAIVKDGAVVNLVLLLTESNSPQVEAEVGGAFWALSEDHPENKDAIAEAMAIPPLITQLASDGERAQTNAANALSSLAFGHNSNQAQIASLLVRLLEEASGGTQDRAAQALWRMVGENPGQEMMIAKAGGTEPQVRLLITKKPAAQAYALWSLSLSIDSESQQIVADTGGIAPLVELLSAQGDPKVCEQAACALHRLAIGNETTQQAIAQQGAITPLIKLLSGGEGRSPEYAAACLSELSCIPTNKVAIDQGGGILPLVALLGEVKSQPKLSLKERLRQATMMSTKINHHQAADFKAIIETAKASTANRLEQTEDMKKWIAETSLKASKRYAAATLARLAYDVESQEKKDVDRKDIISPSPDKKSVTSTPIAPIAPPRATIEKANEIAAAGAIPPLVSLLNGTMGSEAQEEAGGALVALAQTEKCRILITESGGIAPLVLLLGSSNQVSRGHAEAALVKLSIEKPTRVIIIQRLVGMLEASQTMSAKEEATAALVNLARESTENRISILEAGGIPKLLELLKEKSTTVLENAVSALSKLAYQNKKTQAAIAAAQGVAILVQTLTVYLKEATGVKLCELTAEAIRNLANENKYIQTLSLNEGAHIPLVSLLSHPVSKLKANAAGALAALARDHPDNQSAIQKAGAIPPICANVRDGSAETKEESAAVLWSLAKDNTPIKTMIAQLGGIDPLLSMLAFGASDASSAHAAGALAALATSHNENRAIITKKMIASLDTNTSAARARRFLLAVGTLCEDDGPNQDAFSKGGGIQFLIAWMGVAMADETVQLPVAKAMLAIVGNNAATQSIVGRLGAIPNLVEIVKKSSLEAKEKATCALWHLATLPANRRKILQANAIVPLVKLLRAESDSGPQLAAMTLVRLAEGSPSASASIAKAGSIKPLVRLLTKGSPGTQQISASALAALALVTRNRDIIANAGAIEPLVKLLSDKGLGTPETAARALAHLAVDDDKDEHMHEKETGAKDAKVEAEEADPHALDDSAAGVDAGDEIDDDELNVDDIEFASDDEGFHFSMVGSEQRRMHIKEAGGIPTLIAMLDGSNLNPGEILKPAVIGGWSVVGVGIQGCTDIPELFVGSGVAFQARIGMQEQAASTLARLTSRNKCMQDAVLQENGVPPLLSLIRDGSQLAQEAAASTLWSLCHDTGNQKKLIRYPSFLVDLVTLVKSGTPKAQNACAAAIAELLDGYVSGHNRIHRESKEEDPDESSRLETDATHSTSLSDETFKNRRRDNVILAILDAGGVPPLVKLCEHGRMEGKIKAAACFWHLAMDKELQRAIAANGGIRPLVSLFSDSNEEGIRYASKGLARLAIENSDNQAQIAKRLVGLLDNTDASVVSRAAHDLQALAQSHPKCPLVIVGAGAISPLVSVLSNGATEEGRAAASKTLYTLANSGDAEIMTGLAIGLVALLGAGSDLAQECVTGLLLTLSSGSETDISNRHAIANAGPFMMLCHQLKSANAKIRMLAAAVMSRLSGDSDENVKTIAAHGGVPLLVKILDSDGTDLGKEAQSCATTVLDDMTRCNKEHAVVVTNEGGISRLIALLKSKQAIECKAKASSILGVIAWLDPKSSTDAAEKDCTEPLITLLRTENQSAQQAAAYALSGIAAGGLANQDIVQKANGVNVLVELLKKTVSAMAKSVGPNRSPSTEETIDELQVQVLANVSKAIAELARDNKLTQGAFTDHGALQPLIFLVNSAPTESPKEEAAGALWCLASKNTKIQTLIAGAGGMESLVKLVGRTTPRGQEQAAGAFHSLALNHEQNQTKISQLLVQLLRDSSPSSDTQEKAARAISRFASADLADVVGRRNQDSLAFAGCIELTVSLLTPKLHTLHKSDNASKGNLTRQPTLASFKYDPNEDDEGIHRGEHHKTQQELCSALWSLSKGHERNQKLIAQQGGIPLLIALLDDHPDIHYDAAGALWSLSEEPTNQELIAEAGGIPKLCGLLKYVAVNKAARETASGALERLAANADNRVLIADSNGVDLLIPLFDGGSAGTKKHVNAALLALTKDNPSNQFFVCSGLVAMLASAGEETSEVSQQTAAQVSKLEAQTHATRVLYTLSFNAENRDAFTRTSCAVQLVRQLKSGSEEAQSMASDALSNLAQVSADLRVQVTTELVKLLSSNKADVRQRAGTTLRNNNASGGDAKRHQKQAATQGGVAPLVDLLKAGLNDDRVEAQEYALSSLTVINDRNQRRGLVMEGCIPAVIQSLSLGKISPQSQEHAICVLAFIAEDNENHNEIIKAKGIRLLIEALSAEKTLSLTAMRAAATGLAHLAADDVDRQKLVCEAIEPLVKWLSKTDALRLGAARALAAICRGNKPLQVRVAQALAIAPLVSMLEKHASPEGYEAACESIATLAVDNPNNQAEIAQKGAIPLLIRLLQDTKPAICENAALAVAMLSDLADNKLLVANHGGIKPLITLLSTGNLAAKMFAARAVSLLAHENEENQLALIHAAIPLADLLSSELSETQEWAQLAMLRLGLNPSNRATVVKPLVAVLSGRNTSAQLKAAECLAMLLERCPAARSTIASAGAIPPLVQLLGNGQRSDLHTPPERAALVLSELVRLPESKIDVVREGGLQPLVVMLSSSCRESQAHAACALWHLSVVAEHKPMIVGMNSVQPLVKLLTHGSAQSQKCAARTLWQLCSSTDTKVLFVQLNGIQSLVTCLRRNSKSKVTLTPSNSTPPSGAKQSSQYATTQTQARPASSPAPGAAPTGAGQDADEAQEESVQEAVATVLSEFACTQSANRALIVDAGGLTVFMDILCDHSPSNAVVEHVLKGLWGLSQESRYRTKIARREGLIIKLVDLLVNTTGEMQKLAATTLVTLGKTQSARAEMVAAINRPQGEIPESSGSGKNAFDAPRASAVDTLQMLRFMKDAFMRSQVEEILNLISTPSSETTSVGPLQLSLPFQSPRVFSPRIKSNPAPLIDYCAPMVMMPTSLLPGRRTSPTKGASEVLLARFRDKLEANPELWMITRKVTKPEEVTDLYMADLAVQFKVNELVQVTTESPEGEPMLRKATIRFVGKAPEVAPGFWIGVEFAEANGKNDGSLGGTRYFTCEAGHGSFLRPDKIQHIVKTPYAASPTRLTMSNKQAAVQSPGKQRPPSDDGAADLATDRKNPLGKKPDSRPPTVRSIPSSRKLEKSFKDSPKDSSRNKGEASGRTTPAPPTPKSSNGKAGETYKKNTKKRAKLAIAEEDEEE